MTNDSPIRYWKTDMPDEQIAYLLRLWSARSFGTSADDTAIQYGIDLFNGRNPVVRQD
jgi:hypothetical protein